MRGLGQAQVEELDIDKEMERGGSESDHLTAWFSDQLTELSWESGLEPRVAVFPYQENLREFQSGTKECNQDRPRQDFLGCLDRILLASSSDIL